MKTIMSDAFIDELSRQAAALPKILGSFLSKPQGDKAIEAFNSIALLPEDSIGEIKTSHFEIITPTYCISEIAYSVKPSENVRDIYTEIKLILERRVGGLALVRIENNQAAAVVSKERSGLYGQWTFHDNGASCWWTVKGSLLWIAPDKQ